ncbi:small-subunit processome [Xylariales sp. PMI_506]|nr:small-subunit processome [Xylariales sp. PMI_506]
MSSMRNAVHRRNHKERAQPLERQRLGLLEKHKDYSLRAADFNRKKKTLKNLRAKAADRNEDEFYFGMLSRSGPSTIGSKKGKRWTGTVDGDRGNRALDVDAVRLLKTQDIGYLRTVRNTAAKEVRTLEERVVGMGGSLDAKAAAAAEEDDDDDDDDWLDDEGPARKKPRKIVFAEGLEEREERIATTADNVDDNVDDDEGEDDQDAESDGAEEKNPEKLRAEQRQRILLKLQRRLVNARKKLKTLTRTENELELQRARMAKTSTVGGVTKSGKKFKVRERKR